MSSLHTISRSWHDATWLFEQLAFAGPGDHILLLQDAVLAAHSPITLGSFLAKCQAVDVSVCVLQEDCRLRAVQNKYPELQEINYAGFVDLVVQHEKQVAW